ncbi:pentapeptide repeat-containing protein [Aestuariicoccus sp. MJ-SS9]|nr:pentapeptide repeat-containing protein [Aestuariicoccus sp. MJ-SS9]MDU8911111.1 pentapeptide repeat-containing protein [Aestuariicoccus sp. MJ-SS9]
MQEAQLGGVKLQGTDLVRAQLQGARFFEAQFDTSTSFSAAILRGAALKAVDCAMAKFSQDQIEETFGDASVTLGDLKKPAHWDQSDDPLEFFNFHNKWRAWQRSIGMTPDGPSDDAG